jgi:acyl transferase domain-containing protein
LAFLFPDNLTTDAGLEGRLRAREPVFRDVFDRCAACVTETMAGWDMIASPEQAPDRVRQVALQLALSALWESWGVLPDGVFGCGWGDFAALASAGALSCEDAMLLAIGHEQMGSQSGRADAMEAATAGVKYEAPTREFVSAADLRAPDSAEGWVAFLRERAQRAAHAGLALERLRKADYAVFVIIGEAASFDGLAHASQELWLNSIQAGDPTERLALNKALAALYADGRRIDLAAFHGGRRGPWGDVPVYPFEHQVYTLDEPGQDPGSPRVAVLEGVK